jgi:hypothetical protein
MKYQVEKAIEILSATPPTLKALLGSLSADWTSEANAEDVWSAYDIVGHLIHGEETYWIPRARIILSPNGNKTFEPFDRFAQFERSEGKTLSDLLDEFERLRRTNIETLRAMNLTEEHLKLKGTHPELGAVDLEQLLATWVVHDLTHIRQIVTELAKKYSGNVGVWKEYLSILQ